MKSHGTGLAPWRFSHIGTKVVIENEVLIFHPENIYLDNNIYIGHQTILKAYYKNKLQIGSGTWIGQQVFIHAAGGVEIGKNVGIGPGVKILSSSHLLGNQKSPIMQNPIDFKPVTIGSGCDLGINSVILPGVTLGNNCQVGAGAVVTKNFPSQSIIAGVPAVSLEKTR